MHELHKEILAAEQATLLPLISGFSKTFGLVGGTAIALHLGHRRSIDFDLFTNKTFGSQRILNQILNSHQVDKILVNRLDELTLIVKGVKMTFFRFPYKIAYCEDVSGIIKIPSLLTLAAMKAFALGMRNKWKDYVDLYFIIKDHFSVNEISKEGKRIFGSEFNEKLLRTQLGYFNDINYAEEVEFLPGFEVKDEVIKKKLVDFSLE